MSKDIILSFNGELAISNSPIEEVKRDTNSLIVLNMAGSGR